MASSEQPLQASSLELSRRRLGRAALPGPEAPAPSTGWQLVQPEPIRRLEGIRLGRFQPRPGGPYHYCDAVDAHLPESGFSVRVAQGSHGPAVLSAVARDGFELTVAETDAAGGLQWRRKDPYREDLVVAASAGNLTPERLGFQDYAEIGNPGRYWGIIRATHEASGHARYYALIADFAGQPDDWQVHGTVLEVTPTRPSIG